MNVFYNSFYYDKENQILNFGDVLLVEKNYWELTKFLFRGQKIRGTNPITSQAGHGRLLGLFPYCLVQRCCVLVLIKPNLLLGLSILTLFKVVFQA